MALGLPNVFAITAGRARKRSKAPTIKLSKAPGGLLSVPDENDRRGIAITLREIRTEQKHKYNSCREYFSWPCHRILHLGRFGRRRTLPAIAPQTKQLVPTRHAVVGISRVRCDCFETLAT